MPPKRKGTSSKASGAKKSRTSQEASEINPNQPVLYIECCRSWSVFKRRAEALHRDVIDLLSVLKSDVGLQLAINSDGPPRRGSFEVSVAASPSSDVRDRTLIWSGVKNTPRAAKFPAAENIAEDLKRHLNLLTQPAEVSNQVENDIGNEPSSKKSKRGKPIK